MADDDYGFGEVPVAEIALAGQGTDRLTPAECAAIQAYAYNGFEQINKALWGQIPMTPALADRIDQIRSGLAKYPLPTRVRVSREAESKTFGIVDAASAHALVFREFTHRGFLSASGSATPPRSRRHVDPVILDLLVPQGTPALRLGELAEVRDEREVLLIDARTYFIVGVAMDAARNMWRIQAIVAEGEQ
ncbi:ADP-ribosyltransferase [Nocardia concava]|uniref:ADP-ribosyltransferase n=1 Tax=Nocardia concava TaxID=257281 RepID=UPI0005924E18|nr:ADP-ribosyltransferase [Nocardia concava]